MIAKLQLIAIASVLSLTTFAANAAEPSMRTKLVNCGVPHYPKAWVEDEVQGTVRLAVLVGADGSVKDAKVVESSGRRALDKASLRAGATCKAASKDSDNVAGWTTVQYKWVVN
ncbi:MAG TPA: energy transducer TonB [Pseudoduganella sp.]